MKGRGVMPKEKINYAPEYIVGEPLPDGAITASVGTIPWTPVPGGDSPHARVPDGKPIGRDAELAVGWLRDSWLQLSIEADPSYFEMAATHPDGEDSRTSVYTPPLSRDEINKLIRTLRRARDQVFGRDE